MSRGIGLIAGAVTANTGESIAPTNNIWKQTIFINSDNFISYFSIFTQNEPVRHPSPYKQLYCQAMKEHIQEHLVVVKSCFSGAAPLTSPVGKQAIERSLYSGKYE